MRRLLVAGSRSHVPSFDLLDQASYCLDSTFDIIIHGGARGVDTVAAAWAYSKGYAVEAYPAEWDKYGRSAGYRRNAEMVGKATAAIVVWDGESKGTKHTIDLLTEAKLPYVLVVIPR